MKKATKGDWAGFHPGTNCLWAHYLADTLLMRKAFPASAAQKRALRDFRCACMLLLLRACECSHAFHALQQRHGLQADVPTVQTWPRLMH